MQAEAHSSNHKRLADGLLRLAKHLRGDLELLVLARELRRGPRRDVPPGGRHLPRGWCPGERAAVGDGAARAGVRGDGGSGVCPAVLDGVGVRGLAQLKGEEGRVGRSIEWAKGTTKKKFYIIF